MHWSIGATAAPLRRWASKRNTDLSTFPSHIEISPGEFVETIGIEFDAMSEGLVIEHRPGFALLWRDALDRARIAGDHTPAVTDPDVAAAAGGGQAAIQESWIVSALAAGTTRAFGRVVANLGWEDIVFESPARDRDTVYPESRILGKRDSRSRPDQGILHVRTRGVTRGGTEICRFERRLLVYRSAQGPHKKAGYV
jgi:itaconyl-CoA hydratase